ncbi:MAG: hypothetical protein AAGL19_20610 [Pseudomonadota bacterium]
MPRFHIEPLTKERLDCAFTLTTEAFAASSSLHAVLSVDLHLYQTSLRPAFEAMVQEGLSLVATDAKGQMLGALIATDLHATLRDPAPSGPYAQISALTQTLTQIYRAQRAFGPGEVLLVDMAAVHPEARGLGIYRALRQHLEDRSHKSQWHYVVGELSSVATQKLVLEKMGHRTAAEIAFESFEWNGTRPFVSITSPPSIILAEGAL